mgnify:CR=1 FL=1
MAAAEVAVKVDVVDVADHHHLGAGVADAGEALQFGDDLVAGEAGLDQDEVRRRRRAEELDHGDGFRTIRVSGPEMIGGETYERTVAMIDFDAQDSYIVDCFRVNGGSDHAKFFGSSFGTITTNGLNLSDAPDFGDDTQMRSFKTDAKAAPGWSVDWKIDDKYGYVADNRDIHVKYTDHTENAEASICEAWVDTGIYGEASEWIPRVMIRRKGDAGLESTFVSVIEPYEGASKIAKKNLTVLRTENPNSSSFSSFAFSASLRQKIHI